MQDIQIAGHTSLHPDPLIAAGVRLHFLDGSKDSERALPAQMSKVCPLASCLALVALILGFDTYGCGRTTNCNVSGGPQI